LQKEIAEKKIISQRWRFSRSWRRRLLMEMYVDPEMEIALGEGDYSWGAGGVRMEMG
jgi:hypothetical protein